MTRAIYSCDAIQVITELIVRVIPICGERFKLKPRLLLFHSARTWSIKLRKSYVIKKKVTMLRCYINPMTNIDV